jgi:hypothetical protein
MTLKAGTLEDTLITLFLPLTTLREKLTKTCSSLPDAGQLAENHFSTMPASQSVQVFGK